MDGAGFDADAQDVSASSDVGDATVTLVQDETVTAAVLDQARGPLIALMVGLLALAAVIGLAMASALSRPFRELAESAAALGRGRFDIEPPRSRIPEVVSISDSLRASSQRLQKSLRRDRDFFHHASHVLRTPLTGMRLELEELTLRRDLDDDVRRTTSRCLSDVERLDCTIAELLEFARGRALVEGAEVSLLALGSHIAQRWRGQLPESREVKAFMDSGPEMLLTPGPVEQLLDSVLRDVTRVRRRPGDDPLRRPGRARQGHRPLRLVHGYVAATSGSWPSPAGCGPTPTSPARSPRCSAAATRATRRSTSSRSCCPAADAGSPGNRGGPQGLELGLEERHELLGVRHRGRVDLEADPDRVGVAEDRHAQRLAPDPGTQPRMPASSTPAR